METSTHSDTNPLTEASVLTQVGCAANAIGSTRFYEELLRLAASRVPHRFASGYQYWRLGAPTCVAYVGDSENQNNGMYEQGYFRFDPFYRYWRHVGEPGVVTQSDLLDGSESHSSYMQAMMFDWGMTDEIGVFLPSLGGSSLGLFMDRAGGKFDKTHIKALKDLFPALEGLCRAHQRYVFTKGGEPLTDVVHSRPYAIDDANGRRISANDFWLEAEKTTPLLNEAAGKTVNNNDAPVQTDAGFIHSSTLDADFPIAPGGKLHLLEIGAPAPPPLTLGEATDGFFMGELTRRERDVLNLILAGNPGQAIAEKLKISADTVKKHRRRLYDKLDITTERELFIRFLEYVFEAL